MLNPSVSEIISHAPADKVSSECSLVLAGVREAWKFLSEEEYAAVVKGAELLHWSESERFCGRDGSRLERAGVISKRCPECGSEYFPRLNPAIVVLVKRGDEALLVHARNFRGDMMALWRVLWRPERHLKSVWCAR